MNKKLLLMIGIVCVLLSLFPFYQLYALRNISVQHFTIETIGMNQYLQFTVQGTGEFSNPSMIPVTIKQIRYIGYIQQEKVLEGTLEEITIPAKSSASFSFDEEIDWVPDEAAVQDILADNDLILTIEIEADGKYLSLFTITGKKETEINISKLLKPYVEEQLASLTKTVTKFLF